jgi:hypothetical protein
MKNNDIQKQLAKLYRNKRLLWLGILFFVLVVLWILISIFTTTKTSSVSTELREMAKSFVPRLESKVFDEILAKRAFAESELSSFPIYIFDKQSVEGESVIVDIMAESDNQLLEGDLSQELPVIVEQPFATISSQVEVEATAASVQN